MCDTKLKPCPFCGGEAFVDTHRFWDENAKDFTVKTYGIKCYNCQTGTWQHFRTEEDAIKQWNTRKPMDNIVEKLEYSKEMPLTDCGKSYNRALDLAINIVKQEINNGLE